MAKMRAQSRTFAFIVVAFVFGFATNNIVMQDDARVVKKQRDELQHVHAQIDSGDAHTRSNREIDGHANLVGGKKRRSSEAALIANTGADTGADAAGAGIIIAAERAAALLRTEVRQLRDEKRTLSDASVHERTRLAAATKELAEKDETIAQLRRTGKQQAEQLAHHASQLAHHENENELVAAADAAQNNPPSHPAPPPLQQPGVDIDTGTGTGNTNKVDAALQLRLHPKSEAERKATEQWPPERVSKLLEMFPRLAWHSLRTATIPIDSERTYIFTGDIKEMWLRDSAAQAHPLVAVLSPKFPSLLPMLVGVLRQQAEFILSDPYGSAFGRPPKHAVTHPDGKVPDVTGKKGAFTVQTAYELDSPMYFLRLLNSVHAAAEAAGGSSALTKSDFHAAALLIVKLVTQEMQHDAAGSPYRSSELGNNGLGPAVKVNIDLTWTGYRPSDDKCKYGYHIPDNLFAVVSLKQLHRLATALWGDESLAAAALDLSNRIKAAVAKYGTKQMPDGSEIYCYEVDGLGGCNLLDDANIPSLLALPYIDEGGVGYDRAVYAATRKWVLSPANPQYFRGRAISGVGSPHTPKNMVWPMSVIIAALTSHDDDEKLKAIATLIDADAGTGYMHEAIDKDTPSHYSRPWFEWTNGLFVELVATVFPSLVDALPPPPTDEDDGWTFCAFAKEHCAFPGLGVPAANPAGSRSGPGGGLPWPPPPPPRSAHASAKPTHACMRYGARVDGGLFKYQTIGQNGATCTATSGNPAPKLPKHCWVGPVALCKRLLRLEMEAPGRESGGSSSGGKKHAKKTRPATAAERTALKAVVTATSQLHALIKRKATADAIKTARAALAKAKRAAATIAAQADKTAAAAAAARHAAALAAGVADKRKRAAKAPAVKQNKKKKAGAKQTVRT